jgi:regulator of protease activity HflC (stomatin/prohibitin superfamily)
MALPSLERTRAGLVIGAIGAGLVGLIFLLMFVLGWGSVPVDRLGLHYTGGPIEGQKFVKIVEPGSGQQFLGLQDDLVLLPVTQRDYIAGSSENVDGPPIVAPAKGGVEMQFEISAYFTLNTSPDVVRRFYERVYIKFDCTNDAGWDRMLENNFRKPIEQAVQQSIRGYTVDELYAGEAREATTEEDVTSLLVQVQNEIASDLKDNINNILGGDYFCGPTFEREHPDDCPDFQFQIVKAVPTNESVIQSFAENAASQQQVITAQNRAAAEVAEAEGQRRAQEALAGIYTDPAYVAYLQALATQECAKNSNCTLVVTPGSTNVNVSPNRGTNPG